MDPHGFMKELIEKPGLCHLVRNISSFLDVQSLAQCRLVCQSWRDLIDNDQPWLIFQLEHIHTKEKQSKMGIIQIFVFKYMFTTSHYLPRECQPNTSQDLKQELRKCFHNGTISFNKPYKSKEL